MGERPLRGQAPPFWGFGSAIDEGTARGHGPVRPVSEQTDDGPDVGSGGWGVVTGPLRVFGVYS